MRATTTTTVGRRVLVGLAALVALPAALLAALLAVGLAARAWQTAGRDLAPWHTAALEEMSAAALDAADWPGWLAAEAAVFDALRERVTARVAATPGHRVAANRHFAGSPLHAPGFARDWNRSFVLEPEGGPPEGAAVLVHGLTDSPYSVRHLAEAYRARGFVAVAPRMPGHGTAPSGLVGARWEAWAAATRLAVREARRRAGGDRPLHLVGYSNGGALALMAALDAVEDPGRSPRAARVVLVSPMVGVTEFARLAGLPARLLPAFAGAAWLEVLPEHDPFKYNSFPAEAARQSWRLSSAVRDRLARLARGGRLGDMPPVLAFQSVADATVSAPAVVSALFERLPANGSELVLFDVNRDARLGPLLRPEAAALAGALVPPAPRAWRLTLVANRAGGGAEAEERTEPAGAADPLPPRPLGLAWPREVFSLSHVALPFPVSDGLYGLDPDPAEDFGARLGALAVASRGERGVLALGADALLRLRSNPFFPYLAGRVAEGLPPPR